MLANIPKQQKLFVMLGVISALLLSSLNQTIIGTAMPRIVQELGGLDKLSWVFTAFMLSSTITVPIYGKLSDLYGRKYFYMGGIIIFVLGTMLSGISQNMIQLILFRAIQGVGAGAMMANSFAIIGDLFPPAERGRWQGILGAVFGFSSVIGPLLGGYLTDNLSWRWNFFVTAPVGIVSLMIIGFLMPKIHTHMGEKAIDYKGAALLSFGLVSLLLGFVWGGSLYPWISGQIVGLFTISLISILLFVIVEKKAKEPILPLSLFKNSIFSVSSFIIFLSGLGMFGAILYIPLFAQGVLGVSATNSGLILFPLMAGFIVSSTTAGQLISRTGKYKLMAIVGLFLTTLGLYLFSRIHVDISQLDLGIRMAILGIGLGSTMPVFTIAVQNAFPHKDLGVVTASTQLFRSIGGTVGAAVMGGILNSSMATKVSLLNSKGFMHSLVVLPGFSTDNINANSLQQLLSPQGKEMIEKQMSQLSPDLQQQLVPALREFSVEMKEILSMSISEVFLFGAIIMLLAFIASFFLREIPLRRTHDERPVLESAGVELAVEEGNFYKDKGEDVLRRN